jgi:hypothetical protein
LSLRDSVVAAAPAAPEGATAGFAPHALTATAAISAHAPEFENVRTQNV